MMTCTICKHSDQAAINASIVSGAPIRDIACQWHIGRSSVQRHKQTCLKTSLDVMQTESFLETLTLLKEASRKAIQTLTKHLNAKKTNPSVQVRAAQIILETAINVHVYQDLQVQVDEIKETLAAYEGR